MSFVIENVLANFKKEHQILDECMLIVAVSGGCDSMSLLHALHKIHSNIIVAHVNYKLRGIDSERDAELVKQVANYYKLPFKCLVIDLKSELKQNGGNLQRKARDIRRAYFEKLRKCYDSSYIVYAHHQGDQIENFWMHMARGSGIRAMSGMKEKKQQILRPFLSISKKQLLTYAKTNQIQWRNDASNKKNEYTRNIWRNILIPKLKKSLPHIDESVIYLQDVFRETVRQDQKYILSFIINKEKSILLKYTDMVNFNSNQWIELLSQLSIPLSLSESIAVLPLAQNGKKVLIESTQSNYQAIWREEKGLYFQSRNEIQEVIPKFKVEDSILLPKTFSKDTLYLNPKLVKGPIQIRKWRIGDRIHPIGVKGSKLVSDILKDTKTPLRLRENQFVLMDEEKLLALIGFCIDSRALAHQAPCLKIKIEY